MTLFHKEIHRHLWHSRVTSMTSMTSFHQWHLWIYYHYWLNIYLITILFINDINWHQFQTPLIISDNLMTSLNVMKEFSFDYIFSHLLYIYIFFYILFFTYSLNLQFNLYHSRTKEFNSEYLNFIQIRILCKVNCYLKIEVS